MLDKILVYNIEVSVGKKNNKALLLTSHEFSTKYKPIILL